jgi:hypothetical protein
LGDAALEPDADLFLADSSGTIAYHCDPSLIGRSLEEVYPSLGLSGSPEGLSLINLPAFKPSAGYMTSASA